MCADVMFMPPNGLLVLSLIGLPLGVVLGGDRETVGERDILEGARRCACAIDLACCHGCE